VNIKGVVAVTKTWVLMPLANDADKNQVVKKYTGIGPNAKQRIQEAVKWAQEKIPTAAQVWVFGAGTDCDWRRGQTLGVWSESYLRTLLQTNLSVLANHVDKNFYGTHEEMKWGVRAVQKQHPRGTVAFVFFGPWWHLLRVRVIWYLFFKREWGQARFVKTNDGAKPSLIHECKGYLKIFGHRFFPRWVKTRDQTPYPAVVSRFGIEC
jgi:hypothetical protein